MKSDLRLMVGPAACAILLWIAVSGMFGSIFFVANAEAKGDARKAIGTWTIERLSGVRDRNGRVMETASLRDCNNHALDVGGNLNSINGSDSPFLGFRLGDRVRIEYVRARFNLSALAYIKVFRA